MAPVVLVVGEVVDGTLTRLSAEIATLARSLAAAAGGQAIGLVVDPEPAAAATELAGFVSSVEAVTAPQTDVESWAPYALAELERLVADGVTHALVGVTADGRDLAGLIVGRFGWGLLANAGAVTWSEAGPMVEASVLGGKAITTSSFTGATGVITVRPGSVEAEPAASPGTVHAREGAGSLPLPSVRVLERVAEAGAEASLEDARAVVVGGRGIGGAEGFGLVDELAGLLGGVVGATRASVDAGWIAYARQIGQTGKIVKPALYLGLGVSGAMQHRVGMQTAAAIVAVNKDPDAPIAEIADLFVVGDLFEVGPALAAELRARSGG
jgi:electron transfer flavoprotein alpha subunit